MASIDMTVERTGLVTSVGLTSPTACAAIRAKVRNPRATRFVDGQGDWITGHPVALDAPGSGYDKLIHMASMAVVECLQDIDRREWSSIPLLCVAEPTRPGRPALLDDRPIADLERALDARFASASAIVAQGRVGALVAMALARQLMVEGDYRRVLIVAADSLLTWPALGAYQQEGRLLTSRNSNGIIPGEAGTALLMGAGARGDALSCIGIGFGFEKATIESEMPLRGDGLSTAIRQALQECDVGLHDIDFRVVDVSGEQYYFKEAALAVGRLLRELKATFDLFVPAECLGETGAAVGPTLVAVAEAICRKRRSSPSARVLVHLANDAGERGAAVFAYAGS